MALEHLKDAARVIGLKQVRKAMQGGRAAAVFLADDADARITAPLAELCEAQNVPVERVASMAELGKACGIDVGAAAAALTQETC